MEWAVVYDGGRVFTSDDGSPEDAPAFGVLAIMDRGPNWTPPGAVLSQKDYWVRAKWGGWIGYDLIGMVEHFAGLGLLKVGRTVSERDFMAAIETAIALKGGG